MSKSLKIIRNISVFAALFCSLFNAVSADNRYFKIFAISAAALCAVLLICAHIEVAPHGYKAAMTVFYAVTVPAVAAGLLGSIDGYRTGALLLIIISVSELIRLTKRTGKNAVKQIFIVLFAYVPLIITFCFIFCDIKPELRGNETLYASEFPQSGEYETVIKRTYATGRGASVIYYPDGKEGETPVIAYLHGYYIYNISDRYEDTLYYLASCGYIVLAPNYENMFLNPENFTTYAEVQIKDGIKYAENTLKLKPEKACDEYKLGLVGHSVGAVTALNFCAENKMKVDFVLSLDASDGGSDLIPKRDLSGIDENINVLMAVGADDNEACFSTSAGFRNSLSSHDDEKKAFYVLYSDENGDEKVIADHNWMKHNDSTADNLIRYGAHKWAKALAEWSFYGKNYDLWHSDAALNMGKWSDGTDIKPAEIEE